jgi:ferredoxin-NADP reductase/MOSC domain-containing protein YiiM
MKVVSLNLGLPRTVQWKGKAVSTGIFKTPAAGRVALRPLDFDGDGQADLSVHGGPNKAVYVYPAEHYAYWRRELPGTALPWGMFGENLTTEGLQESLVQIGDRFRIGSAVVMATQPRLPCFKLALRFGRDDMVKRLLASGLTGFYFKVVAEGDIGAGDAILPLERAAGSAAVTEITRLYARDPGDLEGLRRIVGIADLPEDWRDYFQERIERLAARRPARRVPAAAWPGYRPFILREKVRESDDVASFHLAPADGEPLPPYRPGQFLTVRLAIPGVDRPAIRSYSLSDIARPESYRLTIKRIGRRPDEPGAAGLVSTHFHERLAIGDRIDVKAPAGGFTLDPDRPDEPVVLIGGGIGITPLLSMVNGIVAAGSSREAWLLYGVRDDREQIMRAHLEAIARSRPNIHLQVFHSRPRAAANAPGPQAGHIDLAALQRLLPSRSFDFYVCGPPAMMDSVTRDLAAWGVAADRVHIEAFGPATIQEEARGPATQPDCGFDVTFARSGVTAQWTRCASPLLELAEEQSVPIAFGCRAGSCGTCATRLVSGSVRYLHEPDAPLAAGEILPCVAVPAEPVVLDA